ncbi:hypothetical protein JCM5296_000663, partial [Sporobolomyces johnsonii]
HILSNHFVLGGLTGLVSTAVLLGDTIAIYRAFFVDHDEFKASTIWQFCILPPAYASGWLLRYRSLPLAVPQKLHSDLSFAGESWATYQAYLHVEGGRHRLRLPAWLANSVFVVGGIATVGALTVLVIVGSRASIREWNVLSDLKSTLSDAAATWESSTMDEAELATIEGRFAALADATNDFYRIATLVAIVGAILPVLLIVINCAMLAWVWVIRRRIARNLERMHSLPVFGALSPIREDDRFEAGTSEAGAGEPSTPPNGSYSKSRSPFSSFRPTFIPLGPFHFAVNEGPSSEPPSPITPVSPTFSPPTTPRSSTLSIKLPGPKPTRADICTNTLLVAVGFSAWCAWSIEPLRHHDVQSWAELEAIMTVPVWVYATGLGFAQALHGWVEWRYLGPVRRGDPSSGSGTAPTSEARPANSVRRVKGDRRGVVESLPSAAYIDRQSRRRAAEGIGARVESIRVTVQVVRMVTMAEADGKDREDEEGDMVEKKPGGSEVGSAGRYSWVEGRREGV